MIYTSGDLDIALPCTLPEFSAPFAGVNVDYLLTQDWSCELASFQPSELNTPHPDYPDYLLVSESNKRDMTNGIVRWTRTYAKMPAMYSQPSASTYSLIGYYTGGGVSVIGRTRQPSVLAARIQFDYFRLNKIDGTIRDASEDVVYAGNAGTLPPLEFVPIIAETRYFGVDLTTTAGGNIGVVQLGIFCDHIGYYSQGVYPAPGTAAPPYWDAPYIDAYPARDAYEYWIAYNRNQQGNGPAPAVPAHIEFATPAAAQAVNYYTNTYTQPVGGNPGQKLFELVVQASAVRRWQGNIVERETVFVLPS